MELFSKRFVPCPSSVLDQCNVCIRRGLKIKIVVRARLCARRRGKGSRNLSRADD